MKEPAGGLLENLPVKERILRYRQLAEEALRKASAASDPELRASRLAEASAWHGLASEIEKSADRPLPGSTAAEADRPQSPSKN